MPSAPPPFTDLPPTPAEHFRLYYFAAVSRLLAGLVEAFGSHEAACEPFPFLAGYADELARRGLDPWAGVTSDWWQEAIQAWERGAPGHLPLRALREAADLDHAALTLLMGVGLAEEDARFGLLFERLQGPSGERRLTLGLLSRWWRAPEDAADPRASVRRLQALGLVRPTNPDAPRGEWALQVATPLWDVLRGDEPDSPDLGIRYCPATRLAALDELVLPDDLRVSLASLPALLQSGDAEAVIVRGPSRNGRRTLLGAIARAIGRGYLEIEGPPRPEDERWRWLGVLATTAGALPTVVLDLGPGESAELPRPTGYVGPVGVVLGRSGGLSGAAVERAPNFVLQMPGLAARRRHWQRSFGAQAVADLEVMAERFRLTSGNIQRAAGLARTYAALDGRARVTPADVQEAARALNRQALETLAERVVTSGDWSHLAVGSETIRELRSLESRCRNRERLGAAVGQALEGALNAGVRTLFSGPSGTGKTLAARLLASVLGMDLYRLDLSSVVNKYIGETEKNLNQVFARAEELDVVLLLDEGDALLTGRTSVQTSNDRYANLETNYLLQRLEAFEGILIVTTNASEHIDSAFQRRMDVVVTFDVPRPAERWAIWQLHLPTAHAIEHSLLEEVARRCELRGGQIRNAVLHAALLALDDGGLIRDVHLEAAVRREYQKVGAVCPLRPFCAGAYA